MSTGQTQEVMSAAEMQARKCLSKKIEIPSEKAPDWPLRVDGWGYDDTQFELNEQGEIGLKGSRYPFSGLVFPNFRPWIERVVGLNVEDQVTPVPMAKPHPPVRNEGFLESVKACCKRMSLTDRDRVFHAHGHTCQEMYALRYGSLARVPDVVVWPGSHEHVERIVHLANQFNVVIIPFGGGTSVSGALICPNGETRMIVSLDMHEMNSIKWIDKDNMLVCVESGIVGQDIKRRLEQYDVTIGHEPDSLEFSTVGGWIATRASGMKKNVYGNIEDMLVRVKMVTSVGTIDRAVEVPRLSMGPDVQQVILGSEGTLGVITEAVFRIRNLPPARNAEYGSILFPNFESGVNFMWEVARERCAPASVRLVDNEQFQFGLALKPRQTNPLASWLDAAKKMYVTKWKNFNPHEMCAATLLMEGTKEEIEQQHKKLSSIAAKHRGMNAGEENGFRGYFLTFMIAYLRDFGIGYHFIAESFETSVPWSNVLVLCEGVKRRIARACKVRGIQREPFVSCRVTQTYDTGACVYFYFGFISKGFKDPSSLFTQIEDEARQEILALGGSLSHHHGIGKHRQQWLESQVSPAGVSVLAGIKSQVDPKNVFGNGNLVGDGKGKIPTSHL